jgi:hypothetical protein
MKVRAMPRHALQVALACAIALPLAVLALLPARDVDAAAPPASGLRPLPSFATIADEGQRSQAYFTELGKVLTHPRCLNCHPAGDRPHQGEHGRLHQPPVERGLDGFGSVSRRCPICHQQANFDPGRMPGHPEWHLAPFEMGWQDKSLHDICVQIKDPARNGGRSLADLIHHIGEDTLVGWAWAPGFGREPAPGTQKQAGALVEAWANSGAACPD